MYPAVYPGASYGTSKTKLTNGSKTDCHTTASGFWDDVFAITVTASAGSAGTATVHLYDVSANDETVIVYQGAVGANDPLSLGGLLHLEAGDIIRVTGANNQHVHVSYLRGSQNRGALGG